MIYSRKCIDERAGFFIVDKMAIPKKYGRPVLTVEEATDMIRYRQGNIKLLR